MEELNKWKEILNGIKNDKCVLENCPSEILLQTNCILEKCPHLEELLKDINLDNEDQIHIQSSHDQNCYGWILFLLLLLIFIIFLIMIQKRWKPFHLIMRTN
jgi:hypothetical protein